MKAINHQKGSIDRDMMIGKNYEIFTIPTSRNGNPYNTEGYGLFRKLCQGSA